MRKICRSKYEEEERSKFRYHSCRRGDNISGLRQNANTKGRSGDERVFCTDVCGFAGRDVAAIYSLGVELVGILAVVDGLLLRYLCGCSGDAVLTCGGGDVTLAEELAVGNTCGPHAYGGVIGAV
ncbi:hypothetical protein E2542_SST22927 [Spatholobus suberectus]|nr:hypothetical protein E2542_SST22927 [Spatholobus suberectus]